MKLRKLIITVMILLIITSLIPLSFAIDDSYSDINDRDLPDEIREDISRRYSRGGNLPEYYRRSPDNPNRIVVVYADESRKAFNIDDSTNTVSPLIGFRSPRTESQSQGETGYDIGTRLHKPYIHVDEDGSFYRVTATSNGNQVDISVRNIDTGVTSELNIPSVLFDDINPNDAYIGRLGNNPEFITIDGRPLIRTGTDPDTDTEEYTTLGRRSASILTLDPNTGLVLRENYEPKGESGFIPSEGTDLDDLVRTGERTDVAIQYRNRHGVLDSETFKAEDWNDFVNNNEDVDDSILMQVAAEAARQGIGINEGDEDTVQGDGIYIHYDTLLNDNDDDDFIFVSGNGGSEKFYPGPNTDFTSLDGGSNSNTRTVERDGRTYIQDQQGNVRAIDVGGNDWISLTYQNNKLESMTFHDGSFQGKGANKKIVYATGVEVDIDGGLYGDVTSDEDSAKENAEKALDILADIQGMDRRNMRSAQNFWRGFMDFLNVGVDINQGLHFIPGYEDWLTEWIPKWETKARSFLSDKGYDFLTEDQPIESAICAKYHEIPIPSENGAAYVDSSPVAYITAAASKWEEFNEDVEITRYFYTISMNVVIGDTDDYEDDNQFTLLMIDNGKKEYERTPPWILNKGQSFKELNGGSTFISSTQMVYKKACIKFLNKNPFENMLSGFYGQDPLGDDHIVCNDITFKSDPEPIDELIEKIEEQTDLEIEDPTPEQQNSGFGTPASLDNLQAK
tara:strand:- start:724 stop:2928 length:2205 start_codon:yes stop_codon:yes gene_type:complete